jgi:hypothetical protein
VHFILNLTTAEALAWADPPTPPASEPTLYWTSLFDEIRDFLYLLNHEAATQAFADVKRILPDQEIVSVPVSAFLTIRASGGYRSPTSAVPASSDSTYRQAYAEGAQARTGGVTGDQNPYPITDLRGIGWANGWQSTT